MEMERIIRIGGVDVKQGSCTVAFSAIMEYDGGFLTTQNIELTHNKLYNLLETAKEVKSYNPKKGEETTKFCVLTQGEIEFHVYVRREK